MVVLVNKISLTAVVIMTAMIFQVSERPTSSTSVSSRYFHLQPNPRRGPVRLGKPWHARSRQVCARSCMERYANCTSFLYNPSTGLCTPGSYINEKQPLPNPAEGDFFQSFYCDIAQGFSVKTFRNTTACAALFGPANYMDADAACQSKGAFLMPVRTFEKYLLLYYNVSRNKNAWVGCDDIKEEGVYIWKDDGQEMTQAEHKAVFASGEPNNYQNGEDCISILANTIGLVDYNCAYLHYYACEMPYRK